MSLKALKAYLQAKSDSPNLWIAGALPTAAVFAHLYASGGLTEHPVVGTLAFAAAAYCSYRFRLAQEAQS